MTERVIAPPVHAVVSGSRLANNWAAANRPTGNQGHAAFST
jgi:hypothetical protein